MGIMDRPLGKKLKARNPNGMKGEIDDRRGHTEAYDPKDHIARFLDEKYDANKRGEPTARRRKIAAPGWYKKERFGHE